jgi:DNA-binding response OmpR family regulator
MSGRILVVDDEPDVRELFNITLKMAGFVTTTARDGIEAMNHIEKDPPDLVLLDLMMPRLDGFGVLERIRELAPPPALRVLVATAKILENSDMTKLSSWPVVGVLRKSEFDLMEVVMHVREALAKESL